MPTSTEKPYCVHMNCYISPYFTPAYKWGNRSLALSTLLQAVAKHRNHEIMMYVYSIITLSAVLLYECTTTVHVLLNRLLIATD
jgi:hypothetical protein